MYYSSAHMMPPELPPKIGDRYRPIRLIGRGGMGIVYEVEHEHTGERLALKLLIGQSNASGDTVDRFKREARASARIKSEYVVRVTDADVASNVDGAPFIVMELLEGTSLEIATKDEPQPAYLVVSWLRQVARALDKAHRLGIVHRDLKPDNLFLTEREDGSPLVKVLDFGIVKMIAERGSTTQGHQLLGTPMYMAPEQATHDNASISGATDRYALGLIAHKLLSGRHYREGETLVRVVADVMRGRVALPSARGSTAGAAFDRWFKRACHTNPEARFPTAVDQVEELASVLGLPKQPVDATNDIVVGVDLDSAPTVEIEGRYATTRSVNRVLWAGGILIGIGLLAFLSAVLFARSANTVTEGRTALASSADMFETGEDGSVRTESTSPLVVASAPASASGSASATTTATKPRESRPKSRPAKLSVSGESAAPRAKDAEKAYVRDPLADQK